MCLKMEDGASKLGKCWRASGLSCIFRNWSKNTTNWDESSNEQSWRNNLYESGYEPMVSIHSFSGVSSQVWMWKATVKDQVVRMVEEFHIYMRLVWCDTLKLSKAPLNKRPSCPEMIEVDNCWNAWYNGLFRTCLSGLNTCRVRHVSAAVHWHLYALVLDFAALVAGFNIERARLTGLSQLSMTRLLWSQLVRCRHLASPAMNRTSMAQRAQRCHSKSWGHWMAEFRWQDWILQTLSTFAVNPWSYICPEDPWRSELRMVLFLPPDYVWYRALS